MPDILGTVESTAGGALQGFLTGGPLGAITGALSGLLPGVEQAIFGKNAATVQPLVQAAVTAVTGTATPTNADIIGLSPDKAAELRGQLAQIAAADHAAQLADAADARKAELAQFQAQLADVASARDQTTKLAGLGSSIAWGAPIISIVIALGFFASLGAMVLAPTVADAGRAAIINIMVGALGSGFTGVVAYWTGSNSQSREKTQMLYNSTPTQGPTP